VNAPDSNAKRITRHYRQTIHAAPQVVWPLLCPVREAEWLDGWQYRLIYSESGLVEEGAVFATPHPGEEDTIWIVTRHDSARHHVDFARVTPSSRASILKIRVAPKGESESYVDVSYTYTSLSPGGDDFITDFTEEAFLKAVTFWERSMNHFLATGRKLERA
jgi:hypothetical protein